MKIKKPTKIYTLIRHKTKSEILNLARMKCKHGMTLLEHPNCLAEFSPSEKVGFLDIETFSFSFKADMGILLTYCIKDLNGAVIANAITPEECKLEKDNDKRLMIELIRDMRRYGRLIGHYSGWFDLPFLRTRALYYGLDFPIYKEIYHTDTWIICKKKFLLKSNSLKNACEFFKIPCKNHKFTFESWYNAAKGNQKAINFVLKHNIEDVRSTELLWKKITSYVNETKSSI